MRRVLADELVHCQRTAADSAGSDFVSTDRLAGAPLPFIRHSKILPVDAEVQRQPWTELPIVLEKQTPFVRVPIAIVQHVAIFIAEERGSNCVGKVKAFANTCD